ncbi:GNAT family N-acetyltransferase [Larkinella rosea]|jgi:GNAT superfamily N-acetyltransferase|uniref:GNAT family N-acetyltransferase n=1 Tax=Larkinella rosea TaxID=2025312 RepID=A0A3P1BUV5_9BACT|nr:GNAT family N-acetyltransferase [Larkinella rosea]RRB04867.1 GNAT family N-acetyltransferase [Larkinella rosea]
MIKIAQTEADVQRCIPAMLALRPHLTAEKALEQIVFMQENDRYVVAFVDNSDRNPAETVAPAAIGYRYMNLLFSGKTLYIDDLSTLPDQRGNGYAGQLLDFVIDEARKAGCSVVTLDSGHNPQRYDAHRLYLNKRFNIVSHHFALKL